MQFVLNQFIVRLEMIKSVIVMSTLMQSASVNETIHSREIR